MTHRVTSNQNEVMQVSSCSPVEAADEHYVGPIVTPRLATECSDLALRLRLEPEALETVLERVRALAPELSSSEARWELTNLGEQPDVVELACALKAAETCETLAALRRGATSQRRGLWQGLGHRAYKLARELGELLDLMCEQRPQGLEYQLLEIRRTSLRQATWLENQRRQAEADLVRRACTDQPTDGKSTASEHEDHVAVWLQIMGSLWLTIGHHGELSVKLIESYPWVTQRDPLQAAWAFSAAIYWLQEQKDRLSVRAHLAWSAEPELAVGAGQHGPRALLEHLDSHEDADRVHAILAWSALLALTRSTRNSADRGAATAWASEPFADLLVRGLDLAARRLPPGRARDLAQRGADAADQTEELLELLRVESALAHDRRASSAKEKADLKNYATWRRVEGEDLSALSPEQLAAHRAHGRDQLERQERRIWARAPWSQALASLAANLRPALASGHQPSIAKYVDLIAALAERCPPVVQRRLELLIAGGDSHALANAAEALGMAGLEIDMAEEARDVEKPATTTEGEGNQDRLKFLRKLGDGAFGDVWLAEDLLLRRQVAAKIFRAAGLGSISWLDQGRALARVDHPNVNKIHSVERVTHPETGAPDTSALILEFVEGSHLEELHEGGRPAPTVERILSIGLQIIDGLTAIHAQGLHHLDLHEGNILITVHDRVKLIDVQYLSSLAGLSTIPARQRDRRDFESLYCVLTRLLRLAKLPPQRIEPLTAMQVGEVWNLARVRAEFEAAFTSRPESAPSPKAAPRPDAQEPAPVWRVARDLIANNRVPDLDGLMRSEFDGLSREIAHRGHAATDEPTPELIRERTAFYETSTESLVGLAAAVGRWGSADHGELLAEYLSGLAEQVALAPSGSHYRATLSLPWYLIGRVVYATGVACHSRESYRPLWAILRREVRSNRGGLLSLSIMQHVALAFLELARTRANALLLPGRESEFTPISNRLLETLYTRIQPVVPASGQRWEALFEETELLVHLECMATMERGLPPSGRFAWKALQAGGEGRDPMAVIMRTYQEHGADWGPLKAGFFRGKGSVFEEAFAKCKERIEKLPWD